MQSESGEAKLDDNMITRFERIPHVTVATPMQRGNLFLKSGEYVMQAYQVFGVRPSAMSQLGYKMQQGRLLD
jgi:ABC-type lipoprotein release transport system permease subunit